MLPVVCGGLDPKMDTEMIVCDHRGWKNASSHEKGDYCIFDFVCSTLPLEVLIQIDTRIWFCLVFKDGGPLQAMNRKTIAFLICSSVLPAPVLIQNGYGNGFWFV